MLATWVKMLYMYSSGMSLTPLTDIAVSLKNHYLHIRRAEILLTHVIASWWTNQVNTQCTGTVVWQNHITAIIISYTSGN